MAASRTSHRRRGSAKLQPDEPSYDGDTVFSHTHRAVVEAQADTDEEDVRETQPTSTCRYSGRVYEQSARNSRACTTGRNTPTRDIEPGRPGIQQPSLRCPPSPSPRSRPTVAKSPSSRAATSGRSPATGGEARLLVSHAANESRPLYSPDGDAARVRLRPHRRRRHLRAHARRPATSSRLTFDDGPEQLDGWSRDGHWIYFSLDQPRHRGHERHLSRARRAAARRCRSAPTATPTSSSPRPRPTASASPSPRAASAPGSGGATDTATSTSREIWLLDTRRPQTPRYERVTERGAKQLWPMWSADGRSLYYMSDAAARRTSGRRPRRRRSRAQVTRFTDGRVLWPTISLRRPDDRLRARLRIWTLDTASGQANEVPITLRGAPPAPATEHVTLTNQLPGPGALARRPEGRVRRARRDLRRVRARRRRRRARDAHAGARVAGRRGRPTAGASSTSPSATAVQHLFLYDFTTQQETQLTSGATATRRRASRRTASRRVRARRQGAARAGPRAQAGTVARARAISARRRSRGRRVVARQPMDRVPRAERASRSATSTSCPRPAATSRAGQLPRQRQRRQRSRGAPTARSSSSTPASARRTAQLVRVDLILRTPRFREDQFRDLFKDETRAASAGARRAGTARRADAGDRRADSRDAETRRATVEAGRDRLRRHPAARQPAAGRRGRRQRRRSAPTASRCC